MLYTLLAEERYRQPVEGGLLYYTQGKQQYNPLPKGARNDKQYTPPKAHDTSNSEDQAVLRVPRIRNEIKALIQARNTMADWMMKRVRKSLRGGADIRLDEAGVAKELPAEDDDRFLPECMDDERSCSKCYAVDACMLFRKVSSSPYSIHSLLTVSC